MRRIKLHIALLATIFPMLTGCLHRPYEMDVPPPAKLLTAATIVEASTKSFTIEEPPISIWPSGEIRRYRFVLKGALPSGLKVGDNVQIFSSCNDDFWVGCRPYLEIVALDGKVYHYWALHSGDPRGVLIKISN